MEVTTQSIDDAVKSMLGQSAAPAQAPAPAPGQAAAAPAGQPEQAATNPNEVNTNPPSNAGTEVAKGIFQAVNSKQQENTNGTTEPESGAQSTEPVQQAQGSDPDSGTDAGDNPDAALAELAEQSKQDPAKSAEPASEPNSTEQGTDAQPGAGEPTDDTDPFKNDTGGTGEQAGGSGSEGTGGTSEEPNAFDDPNSSGDDKGSQASEPSSGSEPAADQGAGQGAAPDTGDDKGSTDSGSENTGAGSSEQGGSQEPEQTGEQGSDQSGDSQNGSQEDDQSGQDSDKEGASKEGSEDDQELERSSDEIAEDIKQERSEDSSQTQQNREMIEEAVSISKRLVEIAEQVADRHPESVNKEGEQKEGEKDEAATEAYHAVMRMGKIGMESLARRAEQVLGYKIDLLSEDPAQEATYITTEQTRSKLGELYRKVSTELPEQREAWTSMRASLDQLKLQEGRPLESPSLASLLTIDGQITDSVFNVGEIILSLAVDHSAWAKSELVSVVMAANQGESAGVKTPQYRAMVKADHQMQDSYSRAGLNVAAATEKLAGDVVFLVGSEIKGPDLDTLRCEVFASADQEGAKINSLSKEALIALDNTIKLNEMVLTKLLKYTGEVIQVLDGLSPSIAKMDPDELIKTSLSRAIAVFCSGPREMLRYMSSYHTAIMLLAKESFDVLAAEPEPQPQQTA